MKILLNFIAAIFCFCLYGQEQSLNEVSSWSEIEQSGKGRIVANWYPSSLFITQTNGQLEGFEYELFKSFIEFTEREYNVSIEVDWQRSADFTDLLQIISTSSKGHFGVSSISITPPRKEVFNITPSHFPDLLVLVSNNQFSTATTAEDFQSIFNKESVAITIPSTTMEQQLLELNNKLKLNSRFVFVDNTGQILSKIESIPNSFGYIDLANFMTALKETTNVKRQYFYPVKLEGLTFVYPKDENWSEPISAYYTSDQFEVDRKSLIEKHLGENVHDLVEKISKSVELGPYEEIILLTEEKELQAKELLASALREQKRQRMLYWLIAGVFLVIILTLVIYVRYQIKVKANEALLANQMLTERHNKQLLTLNQEKNDLIRILAHDLRNPINQLMGFSELLLQNSAEFKGDQIAMLGFIKQSSEKLRDMINKILDVDAIESGNRNVVLEEFKAELILLAVCKDFIRIAEAKGISIKNQIEPNVFVLADKMYLSQILENLVSNAIKFSNSNTEIVLSMFATKNDVVFSVKDQGPGFSKNDQKNIFKKYQQLSAKPTAGESSTGLGLSIVKMFAEMMGGDVTYETEEGAGTTFNVRLPRVK